MKTLIELAVVVLSLTVLLSVVLPFVFVIKKIAGRSNAEAFQFVKVGLGICFGVSATLVIGVTTLNAVNDRDDPFQPSSDSCAQLGGEIQTFDDGSGSRSICVVN